MLTKNVRVEIAIVLLLVSALALAGCFFLPKGPPEAPVSFSVVDGEPSLTWCGENTTLTGLQLFYAPDLKDSSRLIFDKTGSLELSTGESFSLQSMPVGLEGEVNEDVVGPLATSARKVGLNIYEKDPGASRSVTSMSQYRIPEGVSISSWPAGRWLRPDGTFSDQACAG